MLTIERKIIEECVTMGELFERLGFPSTIDASDEVGDSLFDVSEFGIDVLSDAGYHRIEAVRWTKPERSVRLRLHAPDAPAVLELRCSPEHLVFVEEASCQSGGWTSVGNLTRGDVVSTQFGGYHVGDIDPVNGLERLCDLQVREVRRYFADGVLSHNSHFLTFLGANALRAGVDVLHYTFELSEAAVGRRYDSNLCDVDSNDVIEGKDAIIAKYGQMKLGRLMIKEFPTNTATIYTLRSHIERLDLKGFRPGLIIIDYADIMRSTRQYDSLRHELKLIYEELRGFAGEKLLPVWTASQSNKEGSQSDIVDLSNMSEAYGKAMVADAVLSISRKSHEKSKGWGRLFIAKNRAGRDGIVYSIKIDTARSKFEIAGGPGSLDEAKQDDEKTLKKALRSKWQELQNEPAFRKYDNDGSNEPNGSGE